MKRQLTLFEYSFQFNLLKTRADELAELLITFDLQNQDYGNYSFFLISFVEGADFEIINRIVLRIIFF